MSKYPKHTENHPVSKDFNQFDIQKTVQSIWKETNIDSKKSRMINEVISNFRYKEKQMYFTGKIKSCKTNQELDKILTNIVLYGEGLNSIKI